MPQFDIASFYPQITFFAVIFLLFYVFLTKNILPKISQNLKLNRRINDIFSNFATKRFKDINVLSYIYNPNKLISFLVIKEIISIIFLQKFLNIIIIAFVSSLNWLIINKAKNSNIRLQKLNILYFHILNDIFSTKQY